MFLTCDLFSTVSSGRIPWKLKKAGVDLNMLVQRNREELTILKVEMTSYLTYYQKLLSRLQTHPALPTESTASEERMVSFLNVGLGIFAITCSV